LEENLEVKPWSREEVLATVQDYFSMLQYEVLGQAYNKTAHRKNLLKKIDHRSNGAVEKKHQTIGSVLLELGLPYIRGYKPLDNYQNILLEVIDQYLDKEPKILSTLLNYADSTVSTPVQRDLFFTDVTVVEPPLPPPLNLSKKHRTLKRMAEKYDFVDREAKNKNLVKAGEKFILEFETGRLRKEGRADLAAQIEWIPQEKGHRPGYNIRSFEVNGTERFIGVKTTRCGLKFPFILSKQELAFSRKKLDQYYLYRVFNFIKSPALFMLKGRLHRHVKLSPTAFKTRFG
tara:strand:+ start:1977 stop:2843 length:867 start_codon:yes stop_codon:yes gene_type:complete